MNNLKIKKNQSGQVVISAVIFFLIISGALLGGAAVPVGNQVQSTRDLLKSRQSYSAAESVNEEGFFRLNKGQTLPATITLPFQGGVSATGNVTDVSGGQQIMAEGSAGSFIRASRGIFSEGSGASFHYGLQVGNGGITMSNHASIVGNVYANGNISGSGDAEITGTAVSASSINSTPEATNGTSTAPFSAVDLGKTGVGITQVAQSFSISTTTSVAKFSVYIKKTGSPSNITLQVMSNSGSSPSNTQIGSSGTLVASTVTSSYGWIDIYPSSPISLTNGTTYWLKLTISGTSATNYYSIGTNINGYPSKEVKTKTSSGSWTSVTLSESDLYFNVYSGTVSSISGMDIGGNASAFSVSSSNVTGSLYCQTGSGNNKSCDTSQTPPAPLGFSISEANIDEWIVEASAGQSRGSWSLSGSTASTTSGPLKINGSLNLSNSAVLTLGGPLYVTGSVNLSNSSKIKLASSYGSGDEFMIVDGSVNTSNDASFQGSGTSGSYLLVATKNGDININNQGGSVVVVTLNGTANFSNHASAKAVIANRMNMTNDSTLNYETGLTSIVFTGGPTGSWAVDSWQEVSP